MDNYQNHVRRLVQMTLFLIAFALLGWAFTEYKTTFAGLILGTSVSLFNSIYTARKIHRLGDVAISGEKKAISLGSMTRFGTSLLAALVALEYPQTFGLIPTIVGLMITQTIAFFDGIFQHYKSSSARSGKG